jgi:putative tryptophan/tyrosine transport system substrate-binding protein
MTRGLFLAIVVSILATPVLELRAARGTQTDHKVVRLGFVGASSSTTASQGLAAFWDRLRELGYIEGENLVVERRWADGQLERLPALMAEVVAHKVDLIFTSGVIR